MKPIKTFKLSSLTCSILLLLSAQNTQAQQDNSQFIDIPAQNITSALLELAEESHTQILFSSEQALNFQTKALSAQLTVAEALSQLLLGSDFEFIQEGDATFVVRPKKSVATPSLISAAELASVGNTQQPQLKNEASVERIKVTGSNIRVNQDTEALPVTTLTAEDFEDLGIISGADLLAQIPQQGEVSFNSERVIGGVNDARGDVSSINLRGIGTGYTLPLLNGRRLVLHPGSQAEDLVPVTTVNSNSLPVSGLARVEVLRDGAAAIYGSDAIAGVINYVLKDKNDGGELQFQYGKTDGTERDTLSLTGSGGWFFNEGKTHVTLSASVYDIDYLMASERPYSASSDMMNYPGLSEEFVGNTLLDGRTTSTPWGEFSSASLGTFHIQPSTFSGCVVELGNGICADSGSLDRDLRYDSNAARSLSSAVSRYNFYSLITHQLTDEIEAYGEVLYYQAEADRLREQSANLTAQRFTIAADAYYNPFGEDVGLRSYRPIDTGLREINVKDYSYRVLAGLRGYYMDWDWDSALLYSKAHTLDSANRIDTTLFQQAVNSTDAATAYNIFNGASLTSPNTVDDTGNSQSVIDSFMVQIERESETELALYDFKVSRPDLFSLPAGDVGFATGMEYRYESYSDIRSEQLNGTFSFVDLGTGDTTDLASTVLGSSPTPDSGGSRNVLSLYAELAVPLLADLPLIQRLDMQLASRYESFSDVGDIMKPKVSLSWLVNDWLKFRAAYAKGFKAPGLPQTTAVDVARSNTRTDPVFGSRRGVLEIRNGSDELKPETSINTFAGIVLTPTKSLTLTVDWWHIKQRDVVGILNSQTQILYDALLRSEGSSNVSVIRNAGNEIEYVINDYTNLLPREIKGIDYSAEYKLNTQIGKFTFNLSAANLRSFEQGTDNMTLTVLAAQEAGNEALLYNGGQVALSGSDGSLMRLDGRPEWRSNLGVVWRKEQWGAGLKYKYVGDFENTGLYYTADDGSTVYYEVDDWSTLDAYVNYRFENDNSLLKNTKITLGARNLEDKEPPFTSNTFGFESSVHSSAGRYLYMTVNKQF